MKTLAKSILLAGLVLGSSFAHLNAATPLKTDPLGYPLVWEKGSVITYNLEHGALKPSGAYDQAATLQLIKSAFSVWSSIPGIQLKIQQGDYLNDGGDVNLQNFEQTFYGGTKACYPDVLGPSDTPCVSPIVFDPNGEIIESLFGECNQYNILGLGSVDDIDNKTGKPERRIVRRGRLIINGACIPPVSVKPGCAPCAPLSDAELRTVVVHELGHFLGLGHSQVNPQAYEDCKGGASCPASEGDAIPTMFPVNVSGGYMENLHRDDAAYATSVYGNTETSCRISGKAMQTSGGELSGVEVVARNSNTAKSLVDAISAISGTSSPKNTEGKCTQNCGDFSISGLSPGESYQLCAQGINPSFTGISSIGLQGTDIAPSFGEVCPAGAVVKCDCPDPSHCPQFKDVVLTINPSTAAANININSASLPSDTPGTTGSGGGCSLKID